MEESQGFGGSGLLAVVRVSTCGFYTCVSSPRLMTQRDFQSCWDTHFPHTSGGWLTSLLRTSIRVSAELGALSSSSPRAICEGIFLLRWLGRIQGVMRVSLGDWVPGNVCWRPCISGLLFTSCPPGALRLGARLLQAQPLPALSSWHRCGQRGQSSWLVPMVQGCSVCWEFKTNNKIDCKSVCFLSSPCQQF